MPSLCFRKCFRILGNQTLNRGLKWFGQSPHLILHMHHSEEVSVLWVEPKRPNTATSSWLHTHLKKLDITHPSLPNPGHSRPWVRAAPQTTPRMGEQPSEAPSTYPLGWDVTPSMICHTALHTHTHTHQTSRYCPLSILFTIAFVITQYLTVCLHFASPATFGASLSLRSTIQ